MAIPVKLPVFEGPLDLLMHLIEKNKIDIYDIPIVEITDQYLEYIHQMDHEDMDVTSEFLVMAATLLDIKSRMLLPREKDDVTGEEEADPREELVRRLLEYKMYKYMSEELAACRDQAGVRYFRAQNLPKEVRSYQPPIDYEDLLKGTDLKSLENVFHEVLRRKKSRRDPIRSGFGKIRREEINIDTKTLYVRAYLNAHPRTDFRALLESQESKEEVIVTFLILLELMKIQKVHIIQDSICGTILIEADTTEMLVQETPFPGTSAQETFSPEAPANETPSPETLTQEIFSPEAPANETPSPEVLTQETPASEAPANETPSPETLTQETFSPEAPANEMPSPEVLTQETPASETPANDEPAGQDASETASDRPEEEAPAEDILSGQRFFDKTGDTPAEKAPAEGVSPKGIPAEENLIVQNFYGTVDGRKLSTAIACASKPLSFTRMREVTSLFSIPAQASAEDSAQAPAEDSAQAPAEDSASAEYFDDTVIEIPLQHFSDFLWHGSLPRHASGDSHFKGMKDGISCYGGQTTARCTFRRDSLWERNRLSRLWARRR